MSRHQISVATPPRSLHAATSNRCRDTTQATPCCDIKSVSRHCFSCPAQARSRHQVQVATFLETNLCRDINFMSRLCFCPQWDFQVATPKFQVATSPTAAHVATLNPCRDAVSAQQNQTRSRRHFLSRPLHVATSKLGHDLVLEIGSSHSSFCLAQFFFFFKLLQ